MDKVKHKTYSLVSLGFVCKGFDELREMVFTEDEYGNRKDGCVKLYMVNDGESMLLSFTKI